MVWGPRETVFIRGWRKWRMDRWQGYGRLTRFANKTATELKLFVVYRQTRISLRLTSLSPFQSFSASEQGFDKHAVTAGTSLVLPSPNRTFDEHVSLSAGKDPDLRSPQPDSQFDFFQPRHWKLISSTTLWLPSRSSNMLPACSAQNPGNGHVGAAITIK